MAEIKLKMLRGTIVEKKPAKIGQIVSVSKKDADYLVRTGKAKHVESEEQPVPVQEDADASVDADHSEQDEKGEKKPKKGKGK